VQYRDLTSTNLKNWHRIPVAKTNFCRLLTTSLSLECAAISKYGLLVALSLICGYGSGRIALVNRRKRVVLSDAESVIKH
jgi:hypothetical protein